MRNKIDLKNTHGQYKTNRMPTLEEIQETIEQEPSGATPEMSKAKFENLKRNILEEHGLPWNIVKKWKYVGGFKHPDLEWGKPSKRSERLEKLFLDYYPLTGYKWLAYLKVVEARQKCYCETDIHWNYIIVKDLDVFKSTPNVYHANREGLSREYILVGCYCVKHYLGIKTTKTCITCGEEHKNRVNECNNCRTDGKYEIYLCGYCKKRQPVKLKHNKKGKRVCSECRMAQFMYMVNGHNH